MKANGREAAEEPAIEPEGTEQQFELVHGESSVPAHAALAN
jgi:hypothetical protein